jgi:hypothetical protein
LAHGRPAALSGEGAPSAQQQALTAQPGMQRYVLVTDDRITVAGFPPR